MRTRERDTAKGATTVLGRYGGTGNLSGGGGRDSREPAWTITVLGTGQYLLQFEPSVTILNLQLLADTAMTAPSFRYAITSPSAWNIYATNAGTLGNSGFVFLATVKDGRQ